MTSLRNVICIIGMGGLTYLGAAHMLLDNSHLNNMLTVMGYVIIAVVIVLPAITLILVLWACYKSYSKGIPGSKMFGGKF
jgi:hypothetical protein